MAIRYSGDVEVRIQRKGARCLVNVRWPSGRGSVRRFQIVIHCSPKNGERPEAMHDRIARGVLRVLGERVKLPVERGWGGPAIRRVYQAPCPLD